MINAMGDYNLDSRQSHSILTKKVEEMRERLVEGQNTLGQELKLFRQQKEVELKLIIAEFV